MVNQGQLRRIRQSHAGTAWGAILALPYFFVILATQMQSVPLQLAAWTSLVLASLLFDFVELCAASAVFVVFNNCFIGVATSLTGDRPLPVEFGLPSMLFAMSVLAFFLSRGKVHGTIAPILGIVFLFATESIFAIPAFGFVSLMSVRNLLVLMLAFLFGVVSAKEDRTRVDTFVRLLFVMVLANLGYQLLETLGRETLWRLLSYETVLDAKGVGLGVFRSSVAYLESYVRNGGVVMEPVNLSLFAAFSFASLLAAPLGRYSKIIILLLAVVVSILSGGKGGVLVVGIVVGLLFAFRWIKPEAAPTVLVGIWLSSTVFAVFLTGFVGSISSLVLPHFWAISSIPDTIMSPYGIFGHGFGSAGAFNSITAVDTLRSVSDVTDRGSESGVASYIYQNGIIWVLLVVVFVRTALSLDRSSSRKEQIVSAAALLVPWIAAIWQENALSPQAIVLPYVLLGAIMGARFHRNALPMREAGFVTPG